MPIYLTQNRYSPEAISHMINTADGRKEKIAKHIEQVGGKLIDYYFCNGNYDAAGIYEVPDSETALSLCAAVKAMGFVTEMNTTELFTSEEAATAFKKAKGIDITPPKG
jgi:uncharacterized protein with GYD domain